MKRIVFLLCMFNSLVFSNNILNIYYDNQHLINLEKENFKKIYISTDNMKYDILKVKFDNENIKLCKIVEEEKIFCNTTSDFSMLIDVETNSNVFETKILNLKFKYKDQKIEPKKINGVKKEVNNKIIKQDFEVVDDGIVLNNTIIPVNKINDNNNKINDNKININNSKLEEENNTLKKEIKKLNSKYNKVKTELKLFESMVSAEEEKKTEEKLKKCEISKVNNKIYLEEIKELKKEVKDIEDKSFKKISYINKTLDFYKIKLNNLSNELKQEKEKSKDLELMIMKKDNTIKLQQIMLENIPN